MFGPLRRPIAALLPLALAAGLLGGCGSEDDAKTVTALLDRAFDQSLESADVKLDVEAELDGIDDLKDPIELTLQGPYRSGGKTRIPSIDWDITVQAQGQSFNAALVSTGTRAFVGFQGTDYEVSRQTVAELNRQVARGNKQSGANELGDFGVNAREWVIDAEEEGDEKVAGVETTHVSGKLDVARVLDDLNAVVERAAKLGGAVGRQAPPKLTEEQKRKIEEVVDDPRFDVYVGKDDDKIRRLSADIEFEVPEGSRERVGGLEGGTLSFSIEFANVGAARAIKTPTDARPIGELTEQLRGLLGSLGGGSGAAPQGAAPQGSPPPGSGSDDSNDLAPGEAAPDKRRAYEECLQTNPDDPGTKAFCGVLLQ